MDKEFNNFLSKEGANLYFTNRQGITALDMLIDSIHP